MNAPNYAALAASNGSGEPVRATVQVKRDIGSTSIIVNSTTNWPAGTFIATTGTLLSTGKLDPTTAQVFYGTASGTTITITSFAAGYTDKGNAINDVVVVKPTTEWANIVAQGIQSTSQFPGNFQNFVEATAGIWSAGSGLIGSATAGFVWYNGTRSAMAAVTTHTFTASKDTYVDYNPSAATWTYVPVINGATEPAITASCVRVALVITGASAISLIVQTPYNTKVSTSTLKNPCKFSVYLNSSQTSGSASISFKIALDTRTYDTNNNFDITTNHRFVASIPGFYSFKAVSTVFVVPSTDYTAMLWKNGVLAKTGSEEYNSTGGNSNISSVVMGDIYLAVGDYVELFGISGRASISLQNNIDKNFLDCFLISAD